jgi:hypothetical protein
MVSVSLKFEFGLTDSQDGFDRSHFISLTGTQSLPSYTMSSDLPVVYCHKVVLVDARTNAMRLTDMPESVLNGHNKRVFAKMNVSSGFPWHSVRVRYSKYESVHYRVIASSTSRRKKKLLVSYNADELDADEEAHEILFKNLVQCQEQRKAK